MVSCAEMRVGERRRARRMVFVYDDGMRVG
jgi:hypothetical protein